MIFNHCPFCYSELQIVQAHPKEFAILDCWDQPQHPKIRFRIHLGDYVRIYVHSPTFNLSVTQTKDSYIIPKGYLGGIIRFQSSFSDWDWSSANAILSQAKTILAFS